MSDLGKTLRKVSRKIRRLERKLSSLDASLFPEIHRRLGIQLVNATKRREGLLDAKHPHRTASKKLRLVPKSSPVTPIPRPGEPHPDYVKDDDFYKSRGWRQLRYLALKNSRGCQCCGAQAKDGILLHVDHVKPRYKFPHLALCLDNLQVLCEDCNLGKGAWDDTDWRVKL